LNFRSRAAIVLLAGPLLSASCGSGERAPAAIAPTAPSTLPAPAAPDTRLSDRLLPLDAAAHRWVDSVLVSLDARGRAAQLVMAWMSGRYAPVGSAELESLLGWVGELGVGGIITSIGPPVALAEKLNRLQRAAGVPLLVATDMEHGPAQRLTSGVLLPWGTDLGGGAAFPPVMALAAAGDPALAYELGRVTAREARAVGIHLNFAPVADVNNNPANPIINTRSYGEDPAAVSRYVGAHVRGLQDHGMLATAKHFPGHGDVTEDTHIVPFTLRIDRARADSVELVPFRAAIEAGVAAVMTAHITFPELTGDTLTPATLSPALLDGLLVRELGFDGLVVTDALNMGAIVTRFGAAEAAVRALEAGADVLLQPQDPAQVVDAVAAAVASGRVSQERVDRSVRKILEAKARLGLHRERTVALDRVAERVGVGAHLELADQVARRAVTLVRDRDGLVPLDPSRPGRVLAIVYSDDVSPFAARQLTAALGAAIPGFERVLLGPGQRPADLDEVSARALAADRVLFLADVRVRAGKGSVSVEEPVAELVRTLIERRPTVIVSLGNPYLLQQLPGAGSYLLGWGSDRASQGAVADALLGRAPITGRLPISIPPLHRVGEGVDRGDRERDTPGMGAAALALDSVMSDAISRGVTPGAVVAIGGRDGVALVRGYGALDHAPGSPPAGPNSVYDLASLTKAVATTTAVMLQVDQRRMALDDPLSRHLSAWPRGGWRDGVTIRHLLTHTSGLPAFVRFWHPSAGGLRGPTAVVRAIAELSPVHEPGAKVTYSDLGFILLAAAVEEVTGTPLDGFLEREVWAPLGMDDTGFNPVPGGMAAVRAAAGLPVAGAGHVALDRVAPTEIDRAFRQAHVHGVVHDENAYAMGGVAGHAGLFSTATDLARFAWAVLGSLDGGEGLPVRPATVAAFTARQPDVARGLGWDVAPGSGDIARPLSRRAFGHTGFTGTSLWIDPELDLFVVLLTNRVNPSRDGPGIAGLRRAVHGLATELLRSR
jgi:beta-N-acetylhexosaminidase